MEMLLWFLLPGSAFYHAISPNDTWTGSVVYDCDLKNAQGPSEMYCPKCSFLRGPELRKWHTPWIQGRNMELLLLSTLLAFGSCHSRSHGSKEFLLHPVSIHSFTIKCACPVDGPDCRQSWVGPWGLLGTESPGPPQTAALQGGMRPWCGL